MRGIIVAGVIVVCWNAFFLYTAMGVNDPVVASYEAEAR